MIILAIRICIFLRPLWRSRDRSNARNQSINSDIFNAFHDLGALRFVGGSKDDPQV